MRNGIVEEKEDEEARIPLRLGLGFRRETKPWIAAAIADYANEEWGSKRSTKETSHLIAGGFYVAFYTRQTRLVGSVARVSVSYAGEPVAGHR